MIRFISCTACGQTMRVHSRQEGCTLACPSCQTRVKPSASLRPSPPARVDLPVVLPAGAGASRWLPGRPRLWLVGSGTLVALLAAVVGVAGARLSQQDRDPLSPEHAYRSIGDIGRGGFLHVSPPADPAQLLEAVLHFPRAQPLSLPQGEPLPASPTLVGRIPRCLAAVRDPRSGLLLTSALDGSLTVFTADTLRPVRTHQLERTACHLVLDAQRRLLYVTLVAADKLRVNVLGDVANVREDLPADLAVYDLDQLINPANTTGAVPLRRLQTEGHLLGLALTADGRHLLYLADNLRLPHLGRIDTQRWLRDRELPLQRGGSLAFSLSPDGKTVHTLSGARVLAVDVASWEVGNRVAVGGAVYGVLAGNDRRVFLLERRLGMQVSLVDLPTVQVLARWQLELDGRPYLCLSPNGKRLYIGTSAVTAGRILAIDLPVAGSAELTFVGQVQSDRHQLLRGPMLLSNDGQFLITGAGQVFRPVS